MRVRGNTAGIEIEGKWLLLVSFMQKIVVKISSERNPATLDRALKVIRKAFPVPVLYIWTNRTWYLNSAPSCSQRFRGRTPNSLVDVEESLIAKSG